MADWQKPGSPPTLPFDEATYSVSEVCSEVREVLRAAPARWVAGEVQRLRRSRAGHLYFELTEKGEGDQVIGKLEAVAWRRDAQAIERRLAKTGQRLTDGLEIRCRGDLDFYPPFGRLQLVVRDIDSAFILGQLAQRRQATLQALARAGLLERNGRLDLAEVPLDIALVTSEGSAAYHDFLSTLGESGFGFRVLFLHASVQGQAAEQEVESALCFAGTLDVDCAVLIRGGGSKTDLAAFDSRRVAEAVARSPIPVITGLGHDIDLSIADQVAHTSLKTPTQAAEVLVQRARATEQAIEEAARRLLDGSTRALFVARIGVDRVANGARLAALRLDSASRELARLRDLLGREARSRIALGGRSAASLEARLAVAAPRVLGRRQGVAEGLLERIASAARSRLRTAAAGLAGVSRLCVQVGPARTLARGFSITRDGRGRVVTAREQVGVDERLTTQLARGIIVSRVEE